MGEKARGKDKGKKKAVATITDSGIVTTGGAKVIKAGKLGSTIVKACSHKPCVSAYQDKKYGPGVRVFNPAKKGTMCACTVCGTVASL